MYIDSPQLLSDFNVLANLAYLAVLLLAVRKADWPRIRRLDQLNIFLLACVFLVVLWSLRAGVSPGLAMHYLGVTTMTLAFGWPLAVIAGGLTLALLGSIHGMDFHAFGANALVTAVLPALVTQAVYRITVRYLPPNFFIYVFICAFLGGILSLLVSASVVVGLLGMSGAYSMSKISYEYLAYLPLMALPEGVINGMVITVMAALKPGWLVSFDEDRYLGSG